MMSETQRCRNRQKIEEVMKTAEILGADRFENYTKIRDGSRVIIIQDGMILLTHEIYSGWWLLPGGGMEEGETPEVRYSNAFRG